jgi:hypothetical protein
MREQLTRRCNAIEESYEFMLAYAAQGLPGDVGSQSGGQLRHFLNQAVSALTGLGDLCGTLVDQERLEPAEHYRAFASVLDSDARATLAAFQLVLAQPSISSQLIDNLNASIHVRALLTDLFLIDEVLKGGRGQGPGDKAVSGDEARGIREQ